MSSKICRTINFVASWFVLLPPQTLCHGLKPHPEHQEYAPTTIKCFLCQLCMQLTEYAPTTMVYIRSIAEGVNKKSFCGSESQGFVTPYSRQECHSDLAELTIQEHTTYRAYATQFYPAALPGSKRRGRTIFQKKHKEFVERQREASEWKEVFWDSELEAQSPQEISSDTYIIEMELKDNFIITNLSIGTNYSVYVRRCLERNSPKLFIKYRVPCCTTTSNKMDPFFSGKDVIEPGTTMLKVSGDNSFGMVVFLISSLALYMLLTMIRNEASKSRSRQAAALQREGPTPAGEAPSMVFNPHRNSIPRSEVPQIIGGTSDESGLSDIDDVSTRRGWLQQRGATSYRGEGGATGNFRGYTPSIVTSEGESDQEFRGDRLRRTSIASSSSSLWRRR